MKNLLAVTVTLVTGIALLLVCGCETTGTSGGVASHESAVQTGGQPGQQLIQGQSLYPTLETAGPDHIEVQQFGGFGPMGTAAMGDW